VAGSYGDVVNAWELMDAQGKLLANGETFPASASIQLDEPLTCVVEIGAYSFWSVRGEPSNLANVGAGPWLWMMAPPAMTDNNKCQCLMNQEMRTAGCDFIYTEFDMVFDESQQWVGPNEHELCLSSLGEYVVTVVPKAVAVSACSGAPNSGWTLGKFCYGKRSSPLTARAYLAFSSSLILCPLSLVPLSLSLSLLLLVPCALLVPCSDSPLMHPPQRHLSHSTTMACCLLFAR
jgi:hypothetical protein